MSKLTRWIVLIASVALGIALQVLMDRTFAGPSGVLWRAISYFVIINALVLVIVKLFVPKPPKNDPQA